MSAPDYTVVIDKLAEKNWKFKRYNDAPLLSNNELVRFCPVPEEQVNAAFDFLELYTCVAGYDPAHPETLCHTVTDPVASRGGPYTGLWRICKNTKGEEQGEPGIYQTLRSGYQTSILLTGGALDMTEAHIIGQGNYDGNRKEVTVVFPNIAAESLTAVVESVPPTVTDPTVWGAALPAGTWYRKARHGLPQDDGAGMLVLKLSTEPDEVPFTTAGSPPIISGGGVLSALTSSSESRHSLGRFDTRADAITAVNTYLATLADGTHYQAGISQTEEGFVATIEVETAKLRTGTFYYPSQWGGAHGSVTVSGTPVAYDLRDRVTVIDNIKDADLQTLLDAAPQFTFGADGTTMYRLHYGLRPGISPFSGRVVVHLHCSVGNIIQATDPWVNYTDEKRETFMEQYTKDLSQIRFRSKLTSVKQTRDRSAAQTYAYTGGSSGYHMTPDCRVEDHHNGCWKAVCVEVANGWGKWKNATSNSGPSAGEGS